MIVLPSGQNIFPEDIQAMLAQHPNTTDATVVGLTRGSSVEVHAALILDDADTAQEVVSWTNGQLAEQQRIRASPFGRRRTFPAPTPSK